MNLDVSNDHYSILNDYLPFLLSCAPLGILQSLRAAPSNSQLLFAKYHLPHLIRQAEFRRLPMRVLRSEEPACWDGVILCLGVRMERKIWQRLGF